MARNERSTLLRLRGVPLAEAKTRPQGAVISYAKQARQGRTAPRGRQALVNDLLEIVTALRSIPSPESLDRTSGASIAREIRWWR
jgi:hypothetical protein